MSGNSSHLAGTLDAAMQIGAAQREILRKMRAALQQGDNERALDLARELCGLEASGETSNRTHCQ